MLPPAAGRLPDIGIDGCCGRKGVAATAGGYIPLIGVAPTPIYELFAALSNVSFIAGLIAGRLGRSGGIAGLYSLSKCLIGRASLVFGVPGGLKYASDNVNEWG